MSDTGFDSPCLLVSRVRIVRDPQRFGPPPRQFVASACVTALRASSNSTGSLDPGLITVTSDVHTTYGLLNPAGRRTRVRLG